MTKTGEVFFLDDEGRLCLAESFVDEHGNVSTETRVIE